MENEEQYLTEKHYLVCTSGAMPKRMCVDSQNFTRFSGDLAATAKDTQMKSVFICLGSTMFAAGAVAGLACCLIPGPGWVMAAIIAAALIAAVAIGYFICKAAASTRKWLPPTTSQTVTINEAPALVLSSVMMCPKGGTITAKETIWAAWGSQALTDLGHLGNFAFGFLVGRGVGAFASEGVAAYGAAGAEGASASEAIGAGIRTAGQSFLNTAKQSLIEQFNPFGGWAGRSWICNALRGFGLFGAYKQQYDIWSDSDKNLWQKLEASGVSLILSVFAAKGMTLVCFPAGTKVHTQWGLANIERLQEGVPVLTYNEQTGEREYKPVLKTSRRMTQRMCVLEFAGGQMLEVTPEHRFFCSGEWIPVEELEIGSTLQTKNNEYLVIENKTIISKFVEVFNIEVQDNENYFVTEDGILVHNGYRGKPTNINPHDEDPENIRALTRENETAQTLSSEFDVEQNPAGDFGGKKPDYLIDGDIYDCYAPSSDNARNIASNIETQKIQTGQTSNVVINLDDSSVTIDQMSQQLKDYPIQGLNQAIGVKNGVIVILFP